MAVRNAKKTDLSHMVRLLGQLFGIEADFDFDPEKVQRALKAMLDDERSVLAVCETEGRIVGMGTMQRLVSTAEGGAVGLIEDVVVDEGARGNGIGGQILQHLERTARELGYSRLQLLADNDNAPALDFYRENRWTPTKLVALRKHP